MAEPARPAAGRTRPLPEGLETSHPEPTAGRRWQAGPEIYSHIKQHDVGGHRPCRAVPQEGTTIMLSKRITIFKLFGFSVKVDLSWLILALLVAWSLAAGLFPQQIEGLSTATYWGMGVAGAVGLLISIAFHEMAHSLVARRFGLPIHSITLFIFGGVAEMEEEPAAPEAEFWMALMGPVASLVLAGLFYVLGLQGHNAGWPRAVVGVLDWMAFLNVVLAVFNLIPAFPLDGGRVLRAGLWKLKGDLRWATRITSTLGSVFGLLLILLGVVFVLEGNFIGGMWWFLIGLFIRHAAGAGYQRTLLNETLRGEPVSRFMNPEPKTVPPDATVAELVEQHMYRHHLKMFPVVGDGRLVGCVTADDVKKLSREEWEQHTVGEVAEGCGQDRTIAPDSDAVEALNRMSGSGQSRLMVVADGELVGVLALKDLLRFLSLKLDLEQAR